MQQSAVRQIPRPTTTGGKEKEGARERESRNNDNRKNENPPLNQKKSDSASTKNIQAGRKKEKK